MAGQEVSYGVPMQLQHSPGRFLSVLRNRAAQQKLALVTLTLGLYPDIAI
jgi:hypothetical protein